MRRGCIMLSQNNKLFFAISFAVSICFSAVNTEEEKLMEELSGRKKSKPTTMTTSVSERHLYAGLEAFKYKNYILALKHYNTVILKHRKSKEVKSAYLAKAKLYTEMGLRDQAQLNLQMGNKISK